MTRSRALKLDALARRQNCRCCHFQGGKPLVGEVEVRGAKNLVTKAMVAAYLADSPSFLRSVPTSVTSPWCGAFGSPRCCSHRLPTVTFHSTLVKSKVHISLKLMRTRGPVEFRFCFVDRCCTNWAKLSFQTSAAVALAIARLTSTSMRFAPSVLSWKKATKAFVSKLLGDWWVPALICPTRVWEPPSRCCSPLCAPKGVTELTNAAIEPEIMDLIAILQKMGAIILVEPNRTIVIEGVDSLKGFDHKAIPDRSEAASWAAAALATRGNIYVRGC
jgi:UDP-N-acetylglucosamine 1-carboxyvinyltransferase